jgi:hypothetical protein
VAGSPETFVRYAIYKHPQVEAAYYEWLASVEKITRERSLPDPRADVSDGHHEGHHGIDAGADDGFPRAG